MIRTSFLALLCFGLISCQTDGRVRPYGYIKLGRAADLVAPEKFFPDLGILLRHDDKGFYALSTMCTSDLSLLDIQDSEQGRALVSTFNGSKYSLEGKVLSGPAKANLPYYALRFEPSEYDGPKDTLYVEVGKEVPMEWRLLIP